MRLSFRLASEPKKVLVWLHDAGNFWGTLSIGSLVGLRVDDLGTSAGVYKVTQVIYDVYSSPFGNPMENLAVLVEPYDLEI